MEALPFASRPKQSTADNRHKSFQQFRVAVAMEPYERRVFALLQQTNTSKNNKQRKRKLELLEQSRKMEADALAEQQRQKRHRTAAKKEFYRHRNGLVNTDNKQQCDTTKQNSYYRLCVPSKYS
jgi:hypothetical protein